MYYERVYRYAYRRLGDQPAAQNIASETFYRLLVAFQKGKAPQDGVLLWLYRVAHNLVIDDYRQSSKQPLPLLDEAWHTDDDLSPDKAVAAQIAQGQVRAALLELTLVQQQVIELKFMEGMSNEQVAKIMGKPVGTIKSLQHRALAALRRVLSARELPGAQKDLEQG
jgi:RNA polymerase sigma-70 factor (ECF subfamily)